MGPAALVILAPFVGSFLGVLVRRLPRGESIVAPRSHCESCGTKLGVRELLPIASFLLLRGRCRHCGVPIARDHLAAELAATLVPAAALAALPWAGWEAIGAASVLGWVLLALALIDWAHWILPDVLTLPLLVAGLGATALLSPSALPDHAAAAAAGGGGLALLAFTYRRLRGREGLGGGDVKLLAAGGAWVGLQALPLLLAGAAVAGLLLALLRHGRGIEGASAIPFGPPLCGAIWVAFLGQMVQSGPGMPI